MRLTDEQRFVCERDFRWIEYRLGQTDHNFYDELLRNAVQAAILDFFDFHSKLFGESSISTQNAAIMYKFLSMLENGNMFGFSSPAYFSRYVQNYLGVNPSEYRE